MRFIPSRCTSLLLATAIAAPKLAAQQTTSPPPSKTAIAPDTSKRYLRPGDQVHLKVSREPDLSGDFTVNDRGVAVLPRLGEVHVTDLTPDSLRRLVVNTYSKYLRDPAINVIMTRRIAVLGAVKNPGMYQADPTVTVADVIALAGGVTPDGRLDRVELLRDGKEIVTRLTPDIPLVVSPVQSGDQIYVPLRSFLARNPYIVPGVITTVLGAVLAAILVR